MYHIFLWWMVFVGISHASLKNEQPDVNHSEYLRAGHHVLKTQNDTIRFIASLPYKRWSHFLYGYLTSQQRLAVLSSEKFSKKLNHLSEDQFKTFKSVCNSADLQCLSKSKTLHTSKVTQLSSFLQNLLHPTEETLLQQNQRIALCRVLNRLNWVQNLSPDDQTQKELEDSVYTYLLGFFTQDCKQKTLNALKALVSLSESFFQMTAQYSWDPWAFRDLSCQDSFLKAYTGLGESCALDKAMTFAKEKVGHAEKIKSGLWRQIEEKKPDPGEGKLLSSFLIALFDQTYHGNILALLQELQDDSSGIDVYRLQQLYGLMADVNIIKESLKIMEGEGSTKLHENTTSLVLRGQH
jgi:hypothetical protein